jgi:hypothetical protein
MLEKRADELSRGELRVQSDHRRQAGASINPARGSAPALHTRDRAHGLWFNRAGRTAPRLPHHPKERR